jgi:hypothetical protein
MKPTSRRSLSVPFLVITSFALIATACSEPLEEPTGSSEDAVTTCGASLERYPVAGPHNGGWDPNALTFTCGGERANSDFYTGAGDANHTNGHLGNDIFGARGTPIVVAKSGVVTEAGSSNVGGNNVVIGDDCGWSFYYAHLDTIDRGNAVVGRRLAAGTKIGTLGNTGQATSGAPHLHFSAYPNGSYNSGIDPFPLLQSVTATACGGAPVDEPVIEPRPEGGPFPALDVRYPVSAGTWVTQCNESLDGERAWRLRAGGANATSRWAKAEYPQAIGASCGTADNELGIHPLIFRNEPAGTLGATWVVQCAESGRTRRVYQVAAWGIDSHPAAPFHHNEADDSCP